MRKHTTTYCVFTFRRILTLSTLLVLIFSMLALAILVPDNANAAKFTSSSKVFLTSVNSVNLPVPTTTSTVTASDGSSQYLQNQQVLQEAQNDINVANTIISFTGWVFVILTLLVTISGIIGVEEFFRRMGRMRTETTSRIDILTTSTQEKIQQLTNETQEHIRQLTMIEKQFEEQLKLFENKSNALKQDFDKTSQKLEEELEQQKRSMIKESQDFMEATYLFGLGSNAYRIGDNIHAIEYYSKALKLQPNNVRILERLGRANSNLDNMKEAINCLEKALSLDHSNEPALRSLALCYRYTEVEKAIDYLKQCIKINSGSFEALDFLGLIYRDGGFLDEAVSCHEKALAIQKRPETYFYLSILYARKGDLKGAKAMALLADINISKEEHDQRLRPVWKILIQSSVLIIDDNKIEALHFVQTLVQYVTTRRIYNAVKGHLENLLTAIGHAEWIPDFMSIVKLQEEI